MSTKISLTYCGMPGDGRTVTDAKKDAARKIEKALDGHYTPTMMRAGDLIGFIWREPMQGYHYKIVRPDTENGALFGNATGTGEESDTRRACARHMAQNLGSYAGLERYLSPADVRDLDSYFAWQDRYAAFKAQGMTDQEAHDSASNRPGIAA